jgi:hypothetical protein
MPEATNGNGQRHSKNGLISPTAEPLFWPAHLIGNDMRLKRTIAVNVATLLVLGSVAASVRSSTLSKSDGSLTIAYGIPLRWLVLHQRLCTARERQQYGGKWWVTETRHVSLGLLACNLVFATCSGAAVAHLVGSRGQSYSLTSRRARQVARLNE